MPLLILFDIDLTLLRSGGAGLEAMTAAAAAVFGRTLDHAGVDVAGRLDPLILRDLLLANGIEPTPERVLDVRLAYAEALPRHLEGRAEALPGTHALLARLAERGDRVGPSGTLTLGVLTGNFQETGLAKLVAAGFDPAMFPVRVWGDASPHDPPCRDHLPPVGMAAYAKLRGTPPQETVIVGDTPHDVACGLAHGCRVLAVATGRTDANTLARAGAHRVVDDLTATDDLAAWLLGSA